MQSLLGFKERRYIEELRIITRSTALDCVIDEAFDRIIYVIKKGDMGIAIGKNGANIKKLQKILGRRIEMVEHDEEICCFVSNILKPAVVKDLSEDEGGNVMISVISRSDLGIAIGKGGCNVEKARILIQRYFGKSIGEIRLVTEV
ncbi:NusA-like transcription termination signal-binding factor [Methanoplanus endosymbiosus]|uniref:Probable transcription termination protein NusA n=1 Tax=Methanoplanus endosymbiosus TaxID=33865 RepID=A0A9E7PLT8_9EURY|nr:NusA-like transcription termination signal-binding factor [Methanoplanus endosymbiosus]UUX91712.1 NusA-like transcription termination signal-binding factor [Methanoplanus endosymbiosus]